MFHFLRRILRVRPMDFYNKHIYKIYFRKVDLKGAGLVWRLMGAMEFGISNARFGVGGPRLLVRKRLG